MRFNVCGLIKGSCEIFWLVCEEAEPQPGVGGTEFDGVAERRRGPTTTKKSYGDNATLVEQFFGVFSPSGRLSLEACRNDGQQRIRDQ